MIGQMPILSREIQTREFAVSEMQFQYLAENQSSLSRLTFHIPKTSYLDTTIAKE